MNLVTGALCNNGKAAGSATLQDADVGLLVTHALTSEGHDASEDGTGRGTPLIAATLNSGEFRTEPGEHIVTAFIPIDMRQASRGEKFTNNRTDGGPTGIGVGNAGDPAFTVSERGQAVAFQKHQQEVADTLTANWQRSNGAKAGNNVGVLNPIINQTGVRRLMPIECERLMGFPDDWTRWGDDGAEMADSVRYRMCGNGVAVPCVEWIGRRLMEATAPTP